MDRLTAVVALLFLMMGAQRVWAQVEIVNPGFFTVGNTWQFDSVSGTRAFPTTWQIVRSETIGSRETAVLRETVDQSTNELNVFVDDVAMTIVALEETRNTVPPLLITATYSNPLEKIPRFVRLIDNGREFGTGVSFSQVVGNSSNNWTRTQTQRVTWLGFETISVPAFPGGVVTRRIRVNESWTLSNGESGSASRQYWVNPSFGFIRMIFEVTNVSATNVQTFSSVRHDLRLLAPSVSELFVASGTFTPASLRAGETLTVSWVEQNILQAKSVEHVTDVFLSPDDNLDTTDTLIIDNVPVRPMISGGTVSLSRAATVPIALAAGDYRVIIEVDAEDDVAEMNESNGYLLSGTLTVAAASDLRVTEGSFIPSSLGPGEALTVSSTLENRGGRSVPATASQVWLSSDAVLDGGDFLLIGGIAVPALDGGESFAFTESALLPPTLAEGLYRIIVEVDAGDVVDEVDETNNRFVLTGSLNVGRADLQPVSSTGMFAPTAVHAGVSTTVAVQIAVENIGLRTAGTNWMDFALSTDATIDAGDRLLTPSVRLPQLDLNKSITVNNILTIPGDVSAGRYWIGVLVDADNEVPESDEDNNACVVGNEQLIVAGPTDLLAEDLDFLPRAVEQGELLALRGQIRNTGFPTDRSFWVEFWISPNADFSEPRQYLCNSRLIEGLDVNEAFNLNQMDCIVDPAIPDGEYTFGVVVDALNDVNEGNEGNNTVWVTDKRLFIGIQPSRARNWSLYR